MYDCWIDLNCICIVLDVKEKYDFLKGEILIIDKPLGWTSFDVVRKVRNAIKNKLQIKKIKVGHAGTLDPLATGVLVLCTGKKTKEIQSFIDENKSYDGIIQLGSTTPSFDLETEVDKEYEMKDISSAQINDLIKVFSGKILQTPPIFSAKRVQGKRAYELARKGENVELKSRPIVVTKLELILIPGDRLAFKINCSKGTYIRSLARDIGNYLGLGGHLTELRRTASGNFHLHHAMTIDEAMKRIQS